MHVLLVTTSYPDAQSGSEAAGGFVADFACELARHARVTVVAATGEKTSKKREGPLGVHRFAVRRWPLSLLNPQRPTDWWPIVSTLVDGLKAVRDAVESDRPDYILALWALPSGYWARSMNREFGIPYGIWALGSDIWSLGRVPLLRPHLKRVLTDAQDRFADGLQLADDVQGLCGVSCDFLPSARHLPVEHLKDPAESPPYRLAFLGRWHRNKGVDIFLQSLLELSEDDWDRIAEVKVRGGGAMEGEVHRLVAELQARQRPVNIGGYLGADEATDLLAWSDYVMLPSRVESIPVIFSDAAQLRRPLVSTPVGDLPGLFERHEFGILATATTSAEFARALQKALRTPANRFRPELDLLSGDFDIAAVATRFAGHLRRNHR